MYLRIKSLTIILGFFLIQISCKSEEPTVVAIEKEILYEKIDYYTVKDGERAVNSFKSCYTYFFNNRKPHRWIMVDSSGIVTTDYIYEYNDNWVHTGARYHEGESENYSVELVSYSVDSLEKTTTWVDEEGEPYYQMIEDINQWGKPDRARFIGDKFHGSDSAFYDALGRVTIIFFRSVSGRKLNERQYRYDSVLESGDWIVRSKWVADSLNEVQIKTLTYQEDDKGVFYPGAISSSDWNENYLSFSADGEWMFFTRTRDWASQIPMLSRKVEGIYTFPQPLNEDTVYNGSISPGGNVIIYSDNYPEEGVFLVTRLGEWKDRKPLKIGHEAGYFHWTSEEEIYFYIEDAGGDIVRGTIDGDSLKILERITAINTSSAEFSPFVSKDKRFIIFTRYQEGNPEQQGFFISYNRGSSENPEWDSPGKIESLPYGWGACILEDHFIYTDGTNLYSVPINELNILPPNS